MIRLSLNRAPLTEPLRGPFEGVTITLRRLPSPELQAARSAAMSLIRDSSKLVELIDHHDIWPRDANGRRRKVKDFTEDPLVMTGLGEWVAAVECGLRSIAAWTGMLDERGQPLPVSREALEVLFLSEPFLDQVMSLMDRSSQILVTEGNVSGASPIGSSASPLPRTPATAKTAASAATPAPRASPAATESSAPNRKTRRSRRKAPPSGAS